MTNLILRDNSFEDLFDFPRDFDRMFNQMLTVWPFGQARTNGESAAFAPAVESYIDKDEKKYHCRVSLPGIDPKEVQISAQGNMLTIRGEHKVERSAKDVDVYHEEIAYGAFEGTFTMPEGVDVDKLQNS